jgi:hypothetical protein
MVVDAAVGGGLGGASATAYLLARWHAVITFCDRVAPWDAGSTRGLLAARVASTLIFPRGLAFTFNGCTRCSRASLILIIVDASLLLAVVFVFVVLSTLVLLQERAESLLGSLVITIVIVPVA